MAVQFYGSSFPNGHLYNQGGPSAPFGGAAQVDDLVELLCRQADIIVDTWRIAWGIKSRRQFRPTESSSQPRFTSRYRKHQVYRYRFDVPVQEHRWLRCLLICYRHEHNERRHHIANLDDENVMLTSYEVSGCDNTSLLDERLSLAFTSISYSIAGQSQLASSPPDTITFDMTTNQIS